MQREKTQLCSGGKQASNRKHLWMSLDVGLAGKVWKASIVNMFLELTTTLFKIVGRVLKQRFQQKDRNYANGSVQKQGCGNVAFIFKLVKNKNNKNPVNQDFMSNKMILHNEAKVKTFPGGQRLSRWFPRRFASQGIYTFAHFLHSTCILLALSLESLPTPMVPL